ncbi:hypothetical protein D9M71_759330 [compost metagenome]
MNRGAGDQRVELIGIVGQRLVRCDQCRGVVVIFVLQQGKKAAYVGIFRFLLSGSNNQNLGLFGFFQLMQRACMNHQHRGRALWVIAQA